MQAGFELFDHTADIGIRAWAPGLPELFQAAAQGLYAVIGELVAVGDPASVWMDVSGSDTADLLRRFLAELLFTFERDHLLMTKLRVKTLSERVLKAEVSMAAVDWDRSEFSHEVKAVTYHELAITEITGGLEARVIVDI